MMPPFRGVEEDTVVDVLLEILTEHRERRKIRA